MIDVCPVGALTSEPFRYKARTWELARRKSISPHDGLGSNLVVQVKDNRVMRVLPLENENINECWLSDRDRFSYEALNSQERLTTPMIKRDGNWEEVDWTTALEFVAAGLKRIRDAYGGNAVGALASPQSTLEELFLLGKLARGIGSGNVDFRLRQSDFSGDGSLRGAPWLGMKVAAINGLDRVLVVGSTLRKDHPLLAAAISPGVKKGAQFNLINPVDDDLLMRVANKVIVAPSAMPEALGQVLKAAAEAKAMAVPAAVAGLEVGDACPHDRGESRFRRQPRGTSRQPRAASSAGLPVASPGAGTGESRRRAVSVFSERRQTASAVTLRVRCLSGMNPRA